MEDVLKTLFFCTSNDLGVFLPVLDPLAPQCEQVGGSRVHRMLVTCLRDRIDLQNLVFPARWSRDEGFRVSMLLLWSAQRKGAKKLALGQQQTQKTLCADGWREVARVCFLISCHVFGRCVCVSDQ